jgi:non-specific serine/threonine protein kinase
MIGRKFLHYEITEKLGEGGMGVVYLAHDNKLDREVAIKLLPSQVAGNSDERKRFEIEAKAAAGLNHPNIATIYAIENADEDIFIVMEYIDGQELKQLLTSIKNPLSLEKCIDIISQIADGLQAAHEKGIVHRDIKSSNIMITGKGKVKIMDFGLAKIHGAAELTREHSTIGTASYMSPEQVSGGEIDHRSDLWSLGVIFYEMLTGQLPFKGDYEQAVLYAILNEKPRPFPEHLTEIPQRIQEIITKLLQKDPEMRYQDLNQLKEDFKDTESRNQSSLEDSGVNGSTKKPVKSRSPMLIGISVAALVAIATIIFIFFSKGSFDSVETKTERKMIVVLPFENLGEPEDEYFAAGITEEITSRLAAVKSLGVISRNSALQYATTNKTTKVIGEELGVNFVLEGTIRWAKGSGGQNRVRITPQLIRISDDTHLWSNVYDHVLDDIFEVQSDIAKKVVDQLGITLMDPEKEDVAIKPTENLQAYDYFLRGNTYFRRSYLEEDFQIALDMYQKAVELDENFAIAWAQLGESHAAMYWFHYDHNQERLNQAKQAIDRALEIEPDLPEAHRSLGYYYYWGHLDYKRALEHFYYTLNYRPNDSRLYLAIGAVHRRQGDMISAIEAMKQAMELDPRFSEYAFNIAQTYELLRDFKNAEFFYKKAIEISPDWGELYNNLAFMYMSRDGNVKKASEFLSGISPAYLPRVQSQIIDVNVLIAQYEGRLKDALELAQNLDDNQIDNQFFFIPKPMIFAEIYHGMGQKDKERQNYIQAGDILKEKIIVQPEDSRLYSSLGIVYAGLGEKDKAIANGKKAVELLPVSKEAWRGTARLEDLAMIYALTGDYELALNQIEFLLSHPAQFTVNRLKLDPVWKPLFKLPRFKEIINKYQ